MANSGNQQELNVKGNHTYVTVHMGGLDTVGRVKCTYMGENASLMSLISWNRSKTCKLISGPGLRTRELIQSVNV